MAEYDADAATEEQHAVIPVKWKRHEFSDYLTKNGVSAVLANILLELCRAEERSTDPIEFIRVRMRPDNKDVTEIKMYRRKIEVLQEKFDKVQSKKNQLLTIKRRILLAYDCGDNK